MAKHKKNKAKAKKTVKKPARKAKRRKKEVEAEIIFDSTVGETNSLFVSNPEPQPNSPQDPQPKTENNKSFWQKIFPFLR